MREGYTNAKAPIIVITLSRILDLFINQPEHPDASIPIPTNAANIVQIPDATPIPSQCSNNALPEGRTVKIKGIRNAVMVYFHAIIVVL
jgi:hypothetical protein